MCWLCLCSYEQQPGQSASVSDAQKHLLRTGRAVAAPKPACPALPVSIDSCGHQSGGLDLGKLVQVHKLLLIICFAGWSLADRGCLLVLGLLAPAGWAPGSWQ